MELNPDTEILPLIGSKEGIMHICMTYLDEGDGALVPNPGYPTYRSAVKLAGGTCIDYSLTAENGWYPDFEELERVVEAGVLIFAGPASPYLSDVGELPAYAYGKVTGSRFIWAVGGFW